MATASIVSPVELSVQGLRVGTTVLNLWFAAPEAPGGRPSSATSSGSRPTPRPRSGLERTYKALEGEVNESFPDSRVKLSLVGDKVVVTGQARDVAEATAILRVIGANSPQGQGQGQGQGAGAGANGTANTFPVEAGSAASSTRSRSRPGRPRSRSTASCWGGSPTSSTC